MMDEKVLLRRLQAGDHLAFQELYHRYKARVAGNLLRLLRSPDMVEEVLQEIFMRIWANREKLDPEQPVKAYIFRIAENLVRDAFRQAVRDKRAQYVIEARDEAYNHVEDHVLYNEAKQELWRAINLLPPKRREVFVLCKLEYKTYDEVGKLLQISPHTVNDHVKKANIFIKRYLTKRAEAGTVLMLFGGLLF